MTSSEPAHTGAREDALLAGLYVQLEEDYLPNQRPAYDVEAGLGRFIAWLERPRGVTGSARPFNNPILSWSESSGVRLRPRRARPGTALVLVDRRGALLTEWYHRPSPLRARMTARSAYMVDVAEHWLTFACELPCSDDVRRFQVDVDLTWRVHDPAEVVLRNLNDVAAILRPWVEQRMRLVSRKADSLEPEKVEAEINQRLGVAPHQLDCGIIITTLYAKVT